MLIQTIHLDMLALKVHICAQIVLQCAPTGHAVNTGGELPNLPCVFSDNTNRYWKIPKIELPKGSCTAVE